MSGIDQKTLDEFASAKSYLNNAIPAQGIARLAVPPISDKIKLWDALTRNGLAIGIMVAFLIVNAFTLGVLVWLGREDHHDLVRKLIVPADRIVNKDVIISLLGASTVQLGSIAVIMAKYVFRAQVDDPP